MPWAIGFFLSAANFKIQTPSQKVANSLYPREIHYVEQQHNLTNATPKTRILFSISFCKISSCYPFSHGGTVTSAAMQHIHCRETPLEATRDNLVPVWNHIRNLKGQPLYLMKNADVVIGTPMDLGAQKNFPKKVLKKVCVTALDCSFGWQESWLEPNLDSDFFDTGYSNTFPKVLGKKIVYQFTVHPNQHSTLTWLELSWSS